MNALTIWQPWASLIAAGFKPYEFRGWPAPRSAISKRLAIHAGARPVKRDELFDLLARLSSPTSAWSTCLKTEAIDFLERVRTGVVQLPLSHVLCTVTLGNPVRSGEILHEFAGRSGIDSGRTEHQNFAWPMLDIQHLEPPVPARGAQGIWKWEGQG